MKALGLFDGLMDYNTGSESCIIRLTGIKTNISLGGDLTKHACEVYQSVRRVACLPCHITKVKPRLVSTSTSGVLSPLFLKLCNAERKLKR